MANNAVRQIWRQFGKRAMKCGWAWVNEVWVSVGNGWVGHPISAVAATDPPAPGLPTIA